uniref:Uncharacterized protein n=1 Tax=Lepeophtheirus salmonis TaxID=72036 RepID=A0A0K2V555_LEPSM
MEHKTIRKSLIKTSTKLNYLLKNMWMPRTYCQLSVCSPFQEEIDENSINEALEYHLNEIEKSE